MKGLSIIFQGFHVQKNQIFLVTPCVLQCKKFILVSFLHSPPQVVNDKDKECFSPHERVYVNILSFVPFETLFVIVNLVRVQTNRNYMKSLSIVFHGLCMYKNEFFFSFHIMCVATHEIYSFKFLHFVLRRKIRKVSKLMKMRFTSKRSHKLHAV